MQGPCVFYLGDEPSAGAGGGVRDVGPNWVSGGPQKPNHSGSLRVLRVIPGLPASGRSVGLGGILGPADGI